MSTTTAQQPEGSPTGQTAQPASSPLLTVRDLQRSFGGLKAVSNVSFATFPGQIKAIIGPNGAGKTTLFNAITGILEPDAGEIIFQNVPITGKRPYQIAKLGLSRTFQNLNLFSNMSVLENVMVGCHCRSHSGFLAAALRLPRHYSDERRIRASALKQLEVVGMTDHADAPVAGLPFGLRRLVELARALATEPQLLLLDEPASGLNTKETDDLASTIRRIRDNGVTILLVEHDMSLVMDISDDILVLNYGESIAEAPPALVRNDQKVISIYLGGDFDSAPY